MVIFLRCWRDDIGRDGSAEVQGASAFAERAVAPAVGRSGGASARSWRHRGRGARNGDLAQHDLSGHAGSTSEPAASSGTPCSASGKKGKAIPYGVYDLAMNRGWVAVGIPQTESVAGRPQWSVCLSSNRCLTRRVVSRLIVRRAPRSPSAQGHGHRAAVRHHMDVTGPAVSCGPGC